MSKALSGRPLPDDALLASRYGDIAAEALAKVARRRRAVTDDPDGDAQARLHAASIGADPRAPREVTRALMARGVTAARICDLHIPVVARRLGREWETDDLSFSAVTIGSARLQMLLREIGAGAEDEHRWNAAGDARAVLLLVAPEADHTLGAMVLASQLRRRGFSVRLSLGEPGEAILEAMTATRFDAVFLSASIRESLGFLEDALAAIRAAFTSPPPVVLGGALIECEGSTAPIAGVDLVTSDLEEAIGFCGLMAPRLGTNAP